MGLVTKATNGVATRAVGALSNCGPGSNVLELSFSCQGPACSSLDTSLQNVVCHRDGSNILICSNDVKCQPGAATYQSNFTFSQNEPDPWSPTMENKPDIWIPQDQHVMVASCAKFALTSDGTERGTHIVDAKNTCPDVQRLPSLGAMAGHVPTSTGRIRVDTTQRPLNFAGLSSSRNVFRSSLLPTLIFALIFLLPGAHASIYLNDLRQAFEPQSRTASDELQAFAKKLKAELTERASNQGVDGEAFANSLIAGVVLSVCQEYPEGSSPKIFNPEILNNCVASVYSDGQLPQPALQFIAIFGGSILCNYIVSETYPSGKDFQSGICSRLLQLVDRGQSDTATVANLVSSTADPSVVRLGSPGAVLAVVSSDAKSSDQSISALPLQGSASSVEGSVETPKPSTAPVDAVLPSAPIFNHLSIVSSPVNGLPLPVASSDTSGSIALLSQYSALRTAAASLSASSNLINAHTDSTEQSLSWTSLTTPIQSDAAAVKPSSVTELPVSVSSARTAATLSLVESARSSALPDPDLQSIKRASTVPPFTPKMSTGTSKNVPFVSNTPSVIDPATSKPVTVSKLAATNISSGSMTITSTREATSSTTGESDLSDPGQVPSSQRSVTWNDNMTASVGSLQQSSSRFSQKTSGKEEATDAEVQSEMPEPSLLKQSSRVSPFVTADQSNVRSLRKLAPGSQQTSTTYMDTSNPSIISNALNSAQRSDAEPSAHTPRTTIVASKMVQTSAADVYLDTANGAEVWSSPTRGSPSILGQSSNIEPLASTQGQTPLSVEPVHATTETLRTATTPSTTAKTLTASQSSPSPSQINDRLSPGFSVADLTRSASVLSISSSIRTNLQGSQSSRATSLSAASADKQKTREILDTVLSSDLRSSHTVGDLLAVVTSFTGSATIALTLESPSLDPLSSTKIISTPETLATMMSLNTLHTFQSHSEEPASVMTADRSMQAQASDDLSISMSDSGILGTSKEDNTANLVTASAVSLILAASTLAVSLTSVMASESSPAALTPIPNHSSVATTLSSELFGGMLDTELEAWSVSSPFANNSTTTMPNETSRTSRDVTTSITSGSESYPRSSLPTARASSYASAISASDSRSPGFRSLSVPNKSPAPVISATLSIASALLDNISSTSQSDVSLGTSSSSQASKSPSSSANRSVPFESPESSNFVPSSSRLRVPAAILSTSLLSATAVVSSLHGDTAPIVSESTPTRGSFQTTPPAAQIGTPSKPSYKALEATPNATLSTRCAQISSTPDFCPGIGCVSLMTNKAHCGACNHPCVHVCLQGTCVCPDLTSPDEKNECADKPAPVEPIGCPPFLPDMCGDICFNTKSEHNHCGGCGNFCSGTCIDGTCLKWSTQVSPQLVTAGRVVTTTNLHKTTPAQPTLTRAVQPVVAFIWRGLAGPQ